MASNVQYQASTDPEYQALLSQRQQLQDPDAEAAMVTPTHWSTCHITVSNSSVLACCCRPAFLLALLLILA